MTDSDEKDSELELARLRAALDREVERSFDLEKSLNRANAGFEEFVSIAAHNLREPLRDVASNSQLMTEVFSEHLDSEACVLLQRISESARKAQSILTAIVDYWAADSADHQIGPTSLEAVLTQALCITDDAIVKTGAIITHEPLPEVLCDFTTLAKVFHHLIRNAIEYSGTPVPRIFISARRDADEWIISVQDHGAGIEAAFQNRIFGVFKRLHGKDYPGDGLGLAYCRKAIEWQGGRLWVKSTPDSGATFSFTLAPAD